MGHIPPGVDLYSTAARMVDVCGGQRPVMFLASEKLADLLTEYGDVVELAIFAHTHMDEMRLLKPETGGREERRRQNGAVHLAYPRKSSVDNARPG